MLDSISTLAGQFQDSLELQKYCDTQFVVIQQAHEKIVQLQTEVDHLKKLLSTTQLADTPTPIIVTNEQIICEMEIDRLKKTAFERGLTLEETKRLDLLVKNLHLSKDQKKDINVPFRNLTGVSRDLLIEIASQPEPNEDS